MKPTLVKEKVTLETLSLSIEKLATKEELAKLATKEELTAAFSKLATKEEMEESNNDLAGAVKKGFDAVDKRFDALESKVDSMDKRFSNQLDYFHLWYPTREEFTALDDRTTKIERKLRLKA